MTLLTYRISKEIFHLISFCRVFSHILCFGYFALHFFICKAIFLSSLSVRKASELYTWENTPAISLTLCTTNKRNLVLFQLIKRNMLEPEGNIKWWKVFLSSMTMLFNVLWLALLCFCGSRDHFESWAKLWSRKTVVFSFEQLQDSDFVVDFREACF